MKKIIFILLAFTYLSSDGQTSISCPSDKTLNTNSDGVNNYNCTNLVVAGNGVGATIVNGGSCSSSYSLTGATTGSGSGDTVAGITLNLGVTTVNYFLFGASCSASPSTCSFNITTIDNEVPKLTYTAKTVYDTCTFYQVPARVALIPTDNCSISNIPTCKVIRDVVTDETGCNTKAANVKYIGKCIRTWLCTDNAGNTSTFTQTHYLRDMKAPVAVVKQGGPVIKGASNVTYAASNFNNGSYDNCGGAVTLTACLGAGCSNYSANLTITSTYTTGLSSGQQATFPVGIKVTDICGNFVTTTGTIVVQKQ